MRRYQFVEQGSVRGVEWMRSRGPNPRGLVIAPPLIGGHALQQLRLLRPLVRRNFDLLSFSYSGHGDSKGSFSIQASMANSEIALDLAMAQSRMEGLPLYGIASCFSAVPMLQAVCRRGEPISKMVLINALPNLRWEKMVFQFYRYWRTNRQGRLTFSSFRTALKAYRDELLPNVSHAPQGFGILTRHRIQWFQILQDVFASRRSEPKPLTSTPVLCVYGRQDRLLQHIGFSDWKGYETMIERICPHSHFLSIEGDHFLNGERIRQRLIETFRRFFVQG